jgi:hypothetical protein
MPSPFLFVIFGIKKATTERLRLEIAERKSERSSKETTICTLTLQNKLCRNVESWEICVKFAPAEKITKISSFINLRQPTLNNKIWILILREY